MDQFRLCWKVTDDRRNVWVVWNVWDGKNERYTSREDIPSIFQPLANRAIRVRADVINAYRFRVLDLFYPDARWCARIQKDHRWRLSSDLCCREACRADWQKCPYLEGFLTPEDHEAIRTRSPWE